MASVSASASCGVSWPPRTAAAWWASSPRAVSAAAQPGRLRAVARHVGPRRGGGGVQDGGRLVLSQPDQRLDQIAKRHPRLGPIVAAAPPLDQGGEVARRLRTKAAATSATPTMNSFRTDSASVRASASSASAPPDRRCRRSHPARTVPRPAHPGCRCRAAWPAAVAASAPGSAGWAAAPASVTAASPQASTSRCSRQYPSRRSAYDNAAPGRRHRRAMPLVGGSQVVQLGVQPGDPPSVSSSVGRRCIASSVCNSAMRRRAAASSGGTFRDDAPPTSESMKSTKPTPPNPGTSSAPSPPAVPYA